jgi:predicted phosphodiesterase
MPSIPKQDTHPPLSAATMRVYAVSDLHTDYEANMEWVRSLSSSMYQPHTLIVAGDVANSLETFTTTMRILKEKFQHVFFVAGNHDLWCQSTEGPDVSKPILLLPS